MKLFLLLFLIHSPAYSKPITVVFMDDYGPVSFLSPTGDQAIGVSPEITREALSENKEIKLIGLPWKRAQEMVKQGLADAMVSVVTPERLTYATPSKIPAFEDAYRAFTYVGNPRMDELKKIKSIGDLRKFTICEYLGSGWANANLVGKVKAIEFGRSIDSKVFMLAAHRCDLIVDLGFLINSKISHNKLDDKIVELPAVFKGTGFYLMVSKKSPHQEILSLFDKNIKTMKKEGKIESIIKKWTPELSKGP